MTLKVRYEPVHPNIETQKGFDAYLSVSLTRMIKRFGIDNGCENPYRFEIEILRQD